MSGNGGPQPPITPLVRPLRARAAPAPPAASAGQRMTSLEGVEHPVPHPVQHLLETARAPEQQDEQSRSAGEQREGRAVGEQRGDPHHPGGAQHGAGDRGQTADHRDRDEPQRLAAAEPLGREWSPAARPAGHRPRRRWRPETANAVSFTRVGDRPSAAEACSLSRTAMNDRPMPLRRRRDVISRPTRRNPRQTR